MMERLWQTIKGHSPEAVQGLAKAIHVNAILAQLLLHRGVHDFNTAACFFKPDAKQLHDPYLMHGMAKSVQRIIDAMMKKENIMIYGDYDVDGTTAVSIVFDYLKTHYDAIQYYIPDRYTEGYGISKQGIAYAAAQNISVIIALDCGIKAIDAIAKAKSFGIDVIVCDHHLPGPQLPDAFTILNPKQAHCPYPYKELSGAGIGFKLIQALSKQLDDTDKTWAYLDLTVCSIAADIVPLTGENRVLACLGLQQLNTKPRPGLKALLDLGYSKSAVTISTLVFTLAPRINAAGRMKHAHMAIELLLSANDIKARELSGQINDTNTLRRDVDSETTQQALNMITSDPKAEQRYTTVLFNADWHKGIVGIVASRMIESFYKPTIILTESEGKITGSARSVKDFDLYTALEQCAEYLLQFGGHKYAAGLTMDKQHLKAFSDKFESIAAQTISADQRIPTLEIEAELGFQQLTPKFLRVLEKFAPHGPSNLSPLFISRAVLDSGWAHVMGQNHLKLNVFQNQNPNLQFPAMAFNMAHTIDAIQKQVPMDIVYKINFTNPGSSAKSNVQLIIEDMRPTA